LLFGSDYLFWYFMNNDSGVQGYGGKGFSEIDSVLDELVEIEGVKACILYRVDGTPISIKLSGEPVGFSRLINWMENEVKYVMNEIQKRDLDSIVFTFNEMTVFFYPSSRSTVLTTVTDKDVHSQLISIESKRVTEIIGDCVR